MSKYADIKKYAKNKNIIILFSFLILLLIAIILNITIHIVRTNAYNAAYYTINYGEEKEGISISVTVPTATNTWKKEDAEVDNVTNGSTYEFVIYNKKDYEIDDWSFRIDIPKECYLNQAWNGTVEIHQNVLSGNEVVQTLDLHNFSFTYPSLVLEYAGNGKNDLMIHLYQGDYIIYHPANSGSAHEYPLEADTYMTVGMNLYYDTDLRITNFSATYSYNKKINQGTAFTIFIVLSAVWGVLVLMTISWGISKLNDKKELDSREAMLNETIGLITSFVDAKDKYTNGHSTRVAKYTKLLCEQLKMKKHDTLYAYYAAILHDIGKCYVPDEILKKPGKLTDEEFEIIKTHTTYGAEMLKDITSIKGISEGAHYHHERYDGKGYPEGLAGENIPFIARIICVADSFDAMTSSRCYRAALSKDKVLSELERCKGTQFDPVVCEAMIELVNENKIDIPEWNKEITTTK